MIASLRRPTPFQRLSTYFADSAHVPGGVARTARRMRKVTAPAVTCVGSVNVTLRHFLERRSAMIAPAQKESPAPARFRGREPLHGGCNC